MPSFKLCHCPDADARLLQRGQSPPVHRSNLLLSLLALSGVATSIVLASCSTTQPVLPPNAEQLAISPAADNPWQNARLDRTFPAFKSPVKSLALSSDGNILIGGSLNGDTKLWNLTTNQTIRSFTDRPAIQSIAVSPDSGKSGQPQLFASGDYQGSIELHDLASGELRRTLEMRSTAVQSVAFSPDGKVLASGCWDKTANLWDVSTGQLIHTLTGHSYGVTVVAFAPPSHAESAADADTPEDPLLISADYDGGIKLWRSTSGELVRTFAADRYPIFALAVSPDGKILVEGSGNGSIKSWKLPSARYLTSFGGHADAVTTLAISPDGKTLASGSRDKTIKLWDLATGNLIQTLSGSTVDSILTLTFSPDGQRLFSGDQEGMVQVWRSE